MDTIEPHQDASLLPAAPPARPPMQHAASVSEHGWYAPPPILSATPTATALFQALRRRQWLALGVGTLAGALMAATAWLLFPIHYQATATLRVRGQQSGMLRSEQAGDFEAYKRNQQALARSNYVVAAALQKPGVAQLTTIAERPVDPIGWLSDALEVEFPGQAELMQISLSGQHRSELAKIVNAVADAYLQEHVESERGRRSTEISDLEITANKNATQIETLTRTIHETAKQLGTQDSQTAVLIRQRELEELAGLTKRRSELQQQLGGLESKIAMIEKIAKSPDLLAPTEAEIQEYVERDQVIQALFAKTAETEARLFQYRQALRSPNSPRIRALEQEQSRLETLLQERRDLLVKKARETAGSGTVGHPANLPLLKMERDLLAENLTAASQAVHQQQEKISNLETFSAALVTQKAELETLMAVTKNMQTEMQFRKAELNARPRVTRLQMAEEPRSSNVRQKYAVVAFAGATGFGLALFGIAYHEFGRRRVNTPTDLSHGLGLPVIGAIPGISSRPRLGRQVTVQALVSESIDSIRTTLLHMAADGAARVVMVTSAASSEGKTTVATQLAASLARSGRSTLFIDCDLRSPAGHHVFDLGEQSGFCELLRGEATLDSVIHSTSAEGLQMIAAGRCDARCIRFLGRGDLHPIFDELRQRFQFIILDAGPVLGIADAMLVGQYVDGAILSTLRDVSQIPQVYEAYERLRSVNIDVLGTVVNGMNNYALHSRYQVAAKQAEPLGTS